MRKIFLTFIYSSSLCFLIAQDSDQEVWSTWYMKPIHGKAKQLEKGLIDHVKKHHGQGEWPEYYFEILSGPNEGSFAAWSVHIHGKLLMKEYVVKLTLSTGINMSLRLLTCPIMMVLHSLFFMKI